MKKLTLLSLVILCAACMHYTPTAPMHCVDAEVDSVQIDQIVHFDRIVNDGEYLYGVSSLTDSTLYVYSLPEIKYVMAGLRHGQGPCEVKFGPLPADSDTPGAWLYGFTTGKLMHVSIAGDSIISNDTIMVDLPLAFDNLCVIGNSRVSCSLFPARFQVCTQIEGEEPVYYRFGEDSHDPYYSPESALFTSNAATAALAYRYADRVDFLDAVTLKPKGEAGTGEKVEPKTTELPVYTAIRATPDGIYALKVA